MTFVGALLTYYMFNIFKPVMVVEVKTIVYIFIGRIWFLPNLTIVNPLISLVLGKSNFKMMDIGWIEIAGGQGIIRVIMSVSRILDKWNVTHIKLYLFRIFIVLVGCLVL